jgi:hypothetical protein
LTTYGGTELEIVGQIFVDVTYESQFIKYLPLVVVKTDRKQPPLFGLNWLNVIKINWHSFMTVQFSQNVSKVFYIARICTAR